MIQIIEGFILGLGFAVAIGLIKLFKDSRERIKLLRSVFVGNPLLEVENSLVFEAQHGMGIRVSLETGEILYGWANGDEVREITGVQWIERGGAMALSQLAEMEDDEED